MAHKYLKIAAAPLKYHYMVEKYLKISAAQRWNIIWFRVSQAAKSGAEIIQIFTFDFQTEITKYKYFETEVLQLFILDFETLTENIQLSTFDFGTETEIIQIFVLDFESLSWQLYLLAFRFWSTRYKNW